MFIEAVAYLIVLTCTIGLSVENRSIGPNIKKSSKNNPPPPNIPFTSFCYLSPVFLYDYTIASLLET